MKIVFVAVLLSVGFAAAITNDDERRLAYQNPDLFQGDILGFDPDDRNVVPEAKTRWPNKTIPFVIEDSLYNQSALIQTAMDDYHIKTCLRFVRRTTQQNFIRIFKGQGCYSFVGLSSSASQPVSLGEGCHFKGTIIHELGHAIGFFHEQNRSDRDDHLIIHWENIQPGVETQFKRLKEDENLLLTPFDTDSIMIYGNYAFSKDGYSKTMEAKNGQRLLEPIDKEGLAPSDVDRIKQMYDC